MPLIFADVAVACAPFDTSIPAVPLPMSISGARQFGTCPVDSNTARAVEPQRFRLDRPLVGDKLPSTYLDMGSAINSEPEPETSISGTPSPTSTIRAAATVRRR